MKLEDAMQIVNEEADRVSRARAAFNRFTSEEDLKFSSIDVSVETRTFALGVLMAYVRKAEKARCSRCLELMTPEEREA